MRGRLRFLNAFSSHAQRSKADPPLHAMTTHHPSAVVPTSMIPTGPSTTTWGTELRHDSAKGYTTIGLARGFTLVICCFPKTHIQYVKHLSLTCVQWRLAYHIGSHILMHHARAVAAREAARAAHYPVAGCPDRAALIRALWEHARSGEPDSSDSS